jgi:ABC-type glycerol-3-phosphate transport system permease component
MFDRKRPFRHSFLLHGTLVAGAVVFGLPYAWLVGTSWKLDKELQTEEIRILPDKPIATLQSPWIDPQSFPAIVRAGAGVARPLASHIHHPGWLDGKAPERANGRCNKCLDEGDDRPISDLKSQMQNRSFMRASSAGYSTSFLTAPGRTLLGTSSRKPWTVY